MKSFKYWGKNGCFITDYPSYFVKHKFSKISNNAIKLWLFPPMTSRRSSSPIKNLTKGKAFYAYDAMSQYIDCSAVKTI